MISTGQYLLEENMYYMKEKRGKKIVIFTNSEIYKDLKTTHSPLLRIWLTTR